MFNLALHRIMFTSTSFNSIELLANKVHESVRHDYRYKRLNKCAQLICMELWRNNTFYNGCCCLLKELVVYSAFLSSVNNLMSRSFPSRFFVKSLRCRFLSSLFLAVDAFIKIVENMIATAMHSWKTSTYV